MLCLPAAPVSLWRASFATRQPFGWRHCYSHPVGKKLKGKLKLIKELHLTAGEVHSSRP